MDFVGLAILKLLLALLKEKLHVSATPNQSPAHRENLLSAIVRRAEAIAGTIVAGEAWYAAHKAELETDAVILTSLLAELKQLAGAGGAEPAAGAGSGAGAPASP